MFSSTSRDLKAPTLEFPHNHPFFLKAKISAVNKPESIDHLLAKEVKRGLISIHSIFLDSSSWTKLHIWLNLLVNWNRIHLILWWTTDSQKWHPSAHQCHWFCWFCEFSQWKIFCSRMAPGTCTWMPSHFLRSLWNLLHTTPMPHQSCCSCAT